MPPLERVGRAPKDYFVSQQGDPDAPWYVFIADDRNGSTGGFFLYWSQSPRFDTEPLFDNWAESEAALDGWHLEGFEWLDTLEPPVGLAT